MTEYKFKYLDITALGEVTRYLFSYGGLKFDDIRIPFDSYMNKDDSFLKLKKELPFGLLPTLEFDGKLFTQSAAIARYIAIKVDLYGNDPMEGLLIDEAYGNIDDMRKKFSEAKYADPANQPRLVATLKSDVVPYYLTKFDKLVGETGGHFGIPRWNLADMLFGSYIYYCSTIMGENILHGYSNLEKLVAELEALPGIAEYIKTRPKTVV